MAKDPKMLAGLSSWYNAVVLHLAYLKSKPDPDDFDIEFLARGVEHVEFIKSMGMPIEIPNITPQIDPVDSEQPTNTN